MQLTTNKKQNILETIKRLPEETSIEQTMERLYLLSKIEKGCNQADNKQTISNLEAKKRMSKWLH
ncbi:MAG: hypothetical protein B6I31_02755 [Desulfobacteraceae bacterium 4572_19]|nr:MAG: hypothetical protein B6I31_02755 [Desulfobacteraceae bacterium 4572_19]